MTRTHRHLLAFVAASLAGSVAALAQTPVDTGWTYQGRLTDGGAPASGTYDLRFSLFLDDQHHLKSWGPVGSYRGSRPSLSIAAMAPRRRRNPRRRRAGTAVTVATGAEAADEDDAQGGGHALSGLHQAAH